MLLAIIRSASPCGHELLATADAKASAEPFDPGPVPITVVVRNPTPVANKLFETQFWSCLHRLRNAIADER